MDRRVPPPIQTPTARPVSSVSRSRNLFHWLNFIIGLALGLMLGIVGTLLGQKVIHSKPKTFFEAIQQAAEKADPTKPIATFRGVDPDETPPFDVKDDWMFTWECRQNPFLIVAFPLGADGKKHPERNTWFTQWREVGTAGSCSVLKGGRYRIYFDGDVGPWKVEIFQRSNRIE